jgi:hypothetical protein
MLGYGLINYFVHKFSIENIIVSFLNRMVIPNTSYLVGLKILSTKIVGTKAPKNYLTANSISFDGLESEVEDLFNLFLEEEYYITKAIVKTEEGSSLEVDYQKELYKYVLSANILKSKDYNFDNKSKQEVVSEGMQFLKTVFESELKSFLIGITNQFSQDNKNQVLTLLEKKEKNLLLTYNSESGIYSPVLDIKDTLKKILAKYRKDIRDSDKSGFYKFYFENNYLKIRDVYLEVLKKQISSLDDRRII